jgi:hypothetical protein
LAAAAAQIYPMAFPGADSQIDGVVSVDPYALAALLQLTGPIHVTGLAEPLTTDNAAQILVKDQYTTLGSNTERKDFLDEASRTVFDKLAHGSLPSPRKVADTLGTVVAQNRLAFVPLFDADARSLLAEVHADGAFPETDGHDFFEVVTSNKGNNKIDMFLHRQVQYDTSYNPGTGDVEATMTVTLENDAPAAGLPESVIGSNDQGLPPGTNRLYFSLYTPLGLREAKVSGVQTPLEYQRELGDAVYSTYLDIPAGEHRVVELSLFGHLDGGGTYRLDVGHQPLVNTDDVRVHLAAAPDWEIRSDRGFTVDPGSSTATVAASPTEPVSYTATLDRP